MVTKQKAREVVLRLLDAVNSGDLNVIDRTADGILADDYVWHLPGVTDLPPGPAGMKQMLRGVLATNPDLKFTLVDLLVEGDKTAIRCAMYRTDPSSGKPQRGWNLVISRFSGAKIAEDWELISPWEDDR